MGSTTIVRSEPLVSRHEEAVRPPREEVREQLGRILASPLFNHSKHYPSLLRYVVNETLEGRGSHLKERALGVEVFGRDANYDTNADPVVRTSACEVRKRIAQYYHEAGHETEIRIDLPAGSYIPEFRLAAVSTPPFVEEIQAPDKPDKWELARETAWRMRLPVAVAGATVMLLAIGTAWLHGGTNPMESFWSPVWGTNDSAMMVLGGSPLNLQPASANDPGPTFREVMKHDGLAFSDALTMARVTGISREYAKKNLDIRRASAFTLTDLRKGPAILVGAFNNSWTMRLTTDLRYTYEWSEEAKTGYVRDRFHPDNRQWIYRPETPYSQMTKDYAIVSRFTDPLTEKPVIVLAGMGRDGTIAAGEFVSEPRYLEALAKIAPRDWDRKNLQVVLDTDIVKGNTGPPRILATYFWQ